MTRLIAAIAALVVAAPAFAQESAIGEPEIDIQTGQQVESPSEPFFSDSTLADDAFGLSDVPGLSLAEGVDSRFDVHPSDTVILPRPEGRFVIPFD